MESKDNNNKKYIIIAVIVLLLIGGVVLVMGKKDGGASLPSQAASNAASKPSSLKDLLALQTSTKCTVSSTNVEADSQGTIYTAGGKMRGDFESTMKSGQLAGKQMTNHMIIDDTTSYMWGDQMPMGIKMPRTEVTNTATPQTPKGSVNQGGIDINEKSDYHCDGWSADSTVFIPPTDVKFTDMSAMMKNIPATPASAPSAVSAPTTVPSATGAAAPTGMTAAQMAQVCGACDSAGSGRDQCRAALGCK